MKRKIVLLLAAAAMLGLPAAADEGMWLLPYLQKMNIKEMQAKGCQLSAEEIYSVNHSSLKDAIVIGFRRNIRIRRSSCVRSSAVTNTSRL